VRTTEEVGRRTEEACGRARAREARDNSRRAGGARLGRRKLGRLGLQEWFIRRRGRMGDRLMELAAMKGGGMVRTP
jgi:hypothetical protein